MSHESSSQPSGDRYAAPYLSTNAPLSLPQTPMLTNRSRGTLTARSLHTSD